MSPVWEQSEKRQAFPHNNVMDLKCWIYMYVFDISAYTVGIDPCLNKGLARGINTCRQIPKCGPKRKSHICASITCTQSHASQWQASPSYVWPSTTKWVVKCQPYFCSSKEFAAGMWKCPFWDFGCNCLKNRLSLVCNMEKALFRVSWSKKKKKKKKKKPTLFF